MRALQGQPLCRLGNCAGRDTQHPRPYTLCSLPHAMMTWHRSSRWQSVEGAMERTVRNVTVPALNSCVKQDLRASS